MKHGVDTVFTNDSENPYDKKVKFARRAKDSNVVDA
jgi:hypothetical protein